MTRTHGSKRRDAFPYRYAGEELEFEYVAYELDDGTTESLGDTIHVDLTADDDETNPWDTAMVTVRVTVSDDTLDYVFPSSPTDEGALVVTGYCPANHHRFEEVIAPDGNDSLSAGEYEAEVELKRASLRGRVELRPLLVRDDGLESQPAGHGGPPYAERVGQKLAHGPKGTVDVDEPLGGTSPDLPTIPRSFSDSEFAADEGNMWYLSISDPSNPRLYVNSDHGFVVPLFQDEGQHGRGRVRQLVVDMLGTQIMTQFVLKAAELYAIDGEMKYRWQAKMLTQVCDDLFGEKSSDEVDEMLEPGDLSDTVNQITTTIQRRRAPHEDLERVLDLNL